MSIEVLAQATQPRLSEIDAELSAAMKRVSIVARKVYLKESELGELVAIYNNIAYLFLYLESNAAHVEWDGLARWKQAFFGSNALNKALVRSLTQTCFDSVQAERVRTSYIKFFSALNARCEAEQQEFDDLYQRARELRERTRSDFERLLARLGARSRGAPDAAFYNLISKTESISTREKLATAWRRVRDDSAPALEAVVNRLIALRHDRSFRRGFASALSETMQRTRLSESQAEDFIAEYIMLSMDNQDKLDLEVRSAVGAVSTPMQHFEHYVRSVQAGARIPLFDLERCLGFVFMVAKAAFGLEFVLGREAGANVIRVDVCQDGRACGTINFDLWDDAFAPKRANVTIGARNRMAWAGRFQLPVAHVSCRFKRRDEAEGAITFQNVHSLFHEFGHAVNHLLMASIVPSESGLEYLPLERLETLSMWFEKWIFHSNFAPAVAPQSDAHTYIGVAQTIKRLEYRRTHLDRAVTAALDFEVNKSKGLTVRDAFRLLDRRFGISRHCVLEDFLASFMLPMLEANPGGYFSYLFGAAESAEKFALWASSDSSAWPNRHGASETFASCFNFDVPGSTVISRAAFSFYERDTES